MLHEALLFPGSNFLRRILPFLLRILHPLNVCLSDPSFLHRPSMIERQGWSTQFRIEGSCPRRCCLRIVANSAYCPGTWRDDGTSEKTCRRRQRGYLRPHCTRRKRSCQWINCQSTHCCLSKHPKCVQNLRMDDVFSRAVNRFCRDVFPKGVSGCRTVADWSVVYNMLTLGLGMDWIGAMET